MQKNTKRNLQLLALSCGLALLGLGVSASVGGQAEVNHPLQMAAINSKARAAKAGNEAAVRRLVDEVFDQWGFPELADYAGEFQERIVRAEIKFRKERKGGSKEADVVRAVNETFKQLGAPSYARITGRQVRYLRVNLKVVLPDFINQSPTGSKARQPGLSPEMSSLEAASLALFLIHQKLLDKEFQVTPQEWLANQHKKNLAKWSAHRSGRPEAARAPLELTHHAVTARGRELRETIRQTAEALGEQELLALAHRSLNILGIER